MGRGPAHPAALRGRPPAQPGVALPGVSPTGAQGWIRSEWGTSENNRRAKFYRLTALGRTQLAREQEQWELFAGAVHGILHAHLTGPGARGGDRHGTGFARPKRLHAARPAARRRASASWTTRCASTWQMEARRLEREGLPPEEASAGAGALRRCGAIQGADPGGPGDPSRGGRDAGREVRPQDAGQEPGVHAVAVLTLALGIGANTAIYTVVEAVLLEPLPFRDPGQLTLLFTRNDEQNQEKYMVSPMDFDDWRHMNATFESMAAYWPTTGTVLELDGGPTRVRLVYTTEDFFDVMARPRTGGPDLLSGRRSGLDAGGHPQPAASGSVASAPTRRSSGGHHARRRPHRGDRRPARGAHVPGRRGHVDQHDVADADPEPRRALDERRGSSEGEHRHRRGPRRHDRARRAHRAGEPGVEPRVDRHRGAPPGRDGRRHADGAPGPPQRDGPGAPHRLRQRRQSPPVPLRGARPRDRRAHAFGAGRGRLVRQLLTESLVLSGVGAVVGLGLAWLGLRGLLAIAPVTLPREGDIGLDGTVLLVVAGVSLLTGVLFGLAPIGRLLGPTCARPITDGARTTGSASEAPAPERLRRGAVRHGPDARGGSGPARPVLREPPRGRHRLPAGRLLTAELDVATSVAETDTAVIDFYDQFERGIAHCPAWSPWATRPRCRWVSNSTTRSRFRWPTRVPAGGGAAGFPAPGGARLLRHDAHARGGGQGLHDGDRLDAPGAVIVNEAFVRRFLPDDDPLGERFVDLGYRFGPLGALNKSEWEIVGVVKDMKYDGLRAEVPPAIYFSGLQSSIKRRTHLRALHRRPAAAPGRAAGARRDPADAGAHQRAHPRRRRGGGAVTGSFQHAAPVLFGALALVLASVGVYGVLAYAVAQRTGEVGIRMALGADRGDVRTMVLGDGMSSWAWGWPWGWSPPSPSPGPVQPALRGQPAGPGGDGSVVLVLLAVGFRASLIPAWRATRVDPVVAMRGE